MVRFKHSVLAFALLSMPFAHGLGAAFKAIPADKAQSGMAMMEDGAHLLVQHTSADLISVWDVKAQKVVKVLKTKAPQHILCRGRKAFVANYNFGTISVFDSSRDWAKVDEVLTGNQMVYYLSAPGGRNFKNRILASCGKYTSHEYYLVDLSRDAAKLLHKEIYASVATLSYDGSHIIVQGEFSSSPSATVASYPTQTFVDGTRKGKARGNHESTSFLHQVGAGNFWFGLHTLYSGIPPKPFGDKLGTFIIPDVTRDVFYIVDKGFASTHRRTTSRPELAREKITYPSTYTKAKRASSRRFTKTYGYQCPVATTRDDKAYLYIYDPPTSHVYQCAIAAGKTPASVAEAEPKAPDAPDAPPAAGPENFPKQVAEGEKVSHRLYAKNVAGVFSIAQGPAGIRISTNGILTWTPGPKDRGPQQIKIRAQVGGEVSFLRISTEVAPKGAPAAVASAKPGTGKPEPTPTPAAPKATVQEVAAIPTDAPATGMGITEDGAFLLIAHESSNQISVWDVKAQKVIKILSCLSPRHILCRGGKAFVANYNKGTISVFDARKNWALVNEVLAGNPLVYHLSAPGGKHFKGSVLASCGKYTRREFYVVDTIKDSTKLLKKEGYASVATFSYDGVHIIIQGEFGHSPSATVHSYVAKELMTNPRANGAMGNHDDTPYLYQVHEGSFWFGRLNVYAEMPPKPFGKSFTGMIMPDVTRKVFYTLMPTVATTHALNAAMTELATHPVTLSEKWKKSPSRHAHPKSIGARNAWAATHGDKAYLYDYNPGVKAVFQCIIPAKGGAATVAGTAPRTTPATPGAGAHPEAPPVAGAENFPKKIFEGKPLSFRLYAGDVTGAFAVLGGPAGVRISPKGVLTWTPTAKDKGAHQIKVKAEIAGQTSFLRLSTEVLGKEIAALTGGDVARVDDLGVHYLTSGLRGVSVHPRDKTVLLLAASDLRILDPSGIKALRTIPLEHSYVRLAARAKGYVAVANDALHVLDGKTLKPIRKVKLPGSGVTDLALHPNKPVSYVAVHDNEGGKLNPLAARKVACVDESGGRVKILSRVLGQWLAVHPSGRHLYAGIHETYRAGYRLDWNVGAVMPDYGDIDVVVSYEIVGTSIRHRHTNTTPGANGRALRMAPDGAHVAYISGGGYRSGAPQLNGYTIPAFSTDDIRKAAVSYNTDAYPKDVSFHPSLDLVAATNGGTIGIFRRKSGEKIENKLDTGGRKLKDIARLIFTPDGRRLLVDSKDESGRRALRSLGLRLTADESAKLGKPIKVHVPEHAPDIVGPRPTPAAAAIALADLEGLTKPSTAAMSSRDIARAFMDAVVIIGSAEGGGTGFIVGSKGYVLTCAHVIPTLGDPKVAYRTREGGKIVMRSASAQVLHTDAALDLALLKIEPQAPLPVARLDAAAALEIGEAVSVIGHPGLGNEVLDYTMTEGIISNARRLIDGQRHIQTNATVNPGCSGAPLFNSRGNVIGLVVLKANIENTGFAVPVGTLVAFVRSQAGPAPAGAAVAAQPKKLTDPKAIRTCRTWLSMATNFKKAGKPKLARPYLERIIREYPGSSFATDARKMLDGM